MSYLCLLPILIPVLSGALLAVAGPVNKKDVYRNVWVFAATIVTLVSVIACAYGGVSGLELWNLTEELTVALKPDSLGHLFALLTSFVWVLNAFYSFSYMKEEAHLRRYYSVFLLALGAMNGICYAGNIVTLYLFFEMMTLTTVCMVLHEQTKEAVKAGKKYLFYSVCGAFLGLFLFFVLFHYSSTLEFMAGGALDPAKTAGHETLILTATLLGLLGFGAKAGMFPLHGWLPTAHPAAPAPASAILSGNITKIGVFVMIRIVFYQVGSDFLRGTFVQYVFLALSLLTILMGSMMAYMEGGLKKRLAYSTVSQVSYILFGIALMNTVGLAGALLHVVFHSFAKNTLFLNAGAVIHQTGRKNVQDLTGIGREMPVTMWCFTLASLTLVGIPPTSAFLSKWFLARGSLISGIPVFSWIGPIILIVSALLTAGYLITIVMKAFFPGEAISCKAPEKREADARMCVPMLILGVGTLLFGMFPQGLIEFIEMIATLAVR